VPRLVSRGSDEDGSWLVTAALPGQDAASARWKAQPQAAVRAIGEGLRAMHESLPVAACPFSWAAGDRLADLRRQVSDGRTDPVCWPSPGGPLDTGRVLERLGRIPPPDRLVVCHGDSCAPNTMLDNDGHWSAHVDLGDLGVADRWADLAIATWSAELNFGPGWERPLLDAYGITPDPDRTRYYRLLGRCP
jgi:kanamycin kinase